MTTLPPPSNQRPHTPEETKDLQRLDIFSYLKKHSCTKRCPGCGQAIKMLNRRRYCARCVSTRCDTYGSINTHYSNAAPAPTQNPSAEGISRP